MKKSDIKILCVDDEPDILEILKYNLSNAGYEIYLANEGLSAIKKAEEIIPNLIIMDVMMPKMDGIQACENLRANEKFNDTVIMFLTARGEDFSHLAAYEAGADDYVTKPVKPKILISKVKGLLRRFKKVTDNDIAIIELNDIIIDMLNSNELLFLKRTKTTFIAEGIITDGYIELYGDYNEELAIIFSSLHDKLNSFFAYLNNQYWNKYCHADRRCINRI